MQGEGEGVVLMQCCGQSQLCSHFDYLYFHDTQNEIVGEIMLRNIPV